MREQIRIARTLTGRPIGVNVMLMSPYAGQVAEAAAEEKVAVVTTGAGHVGELTTMVLVPQVCDAAGGIADGRGAAAVVHKVQPAAEIIREVMEEAEPILRGAPPWVE